MNGIWGKWYCCKVGQPKKAFIQVTEITTAVTAGLQLIKTFFSKMCVEEKNNIHLDPPQTSAVFIDKYGRGINQDHRIDLQFNNILIIDIETKIF